MPTVSFVIPNLFHEMHSGPGIAQQVKTGDAWLQTYMDGYIQWARTHNSLLILTWDEDASDRQADRQLIPTIFVGARLKPGRYGEAINHCNLLRTLEDMYQLPHCTRRRCEGGPDYRRVQPAQDDKSRAMMKKTRIAIALIAFCACGRLAAENGPPIDRQALVTRHNIEWNEVAGEIPLGNGEFAFNVDGTGLQTFGGNAMSHWGWHSAPLPAGCSAADVPATGTVDRGRIVGPMRQSGRAGRSLTSGCSRTRIR